MVNNKSDHSLDSIFSALSDPTRRAILQRLAQGEASVTEVYEPFEGNKTWPSISRHLRILEEVGLIVRQKEGRIHYLTLVAAPMKEAVTWLEYYRHFWDEQLDALADFLTSTTDQDNKGSYDSTDI